MSRPPDPLVVRAWRERQEAEEKAKAALALREKEERRGSPALVLGHFDRHIAQASERERKLTRLAVSTGVLCVVTAGLAATVSSLAPLLVFSAFALALTFLTGSTAIGARTNRRSTVELREAVTARWHEHVPDIEHGPELPTEGFVVYVADKTNVKRPEAVEINFEIKSYEWEYDTWVAGDDRIEIGALLPGYEGRRAFFATDPLEEIAAAWASFCLTVDEVNKRTWQQSAEAELSKASREEEAKAALTAEAEKLADQESVVGLLPSMRDVIGN